MQGSGSSYIETLNLKIQSDPIAREALAKLVDQVEALTLSDLEKTNIIAEQTRTIARLVEQKSVSDVSERYDRALKAIAEGDKTLADEILGEAIDDVELDLEKSEKALQEQTQKAIELYIERGALWFASDTDKALDAYQRVVELDPSNLDAINQLAQLHVRIGNLSKAEDLYQSLTQLTDDKEWQAISYGNLGLVYQARGELDKAIEYHEKALAISEALGRKEGMANQYGNLGLVYRTRGELDKAIEYYEKALAINEALGRKEGVAIQYGNLGLVYQTRGELDKATEYHEKALAISEALSLKEGVASQYGNIGNVYQTRGELDKAIEYYEKSLEIEKALGRKEGMASDYGNLGLVYQTRGELDKAKTVWEKSAALFLELGSPNYEKVKMLLEELDNSLVAD